MTACRVTEDLNAMHNREDEVDAICDMFEDEITIRAQELHDLDPLSDYDDCLSMAEAEIIREHL